MKRTKRRTTRSRHRIEPLERRRLFAVNVLVHHGDPANDGANLAETVLTPSNVNSTDFGKQFSTKLDGAVYAQPLYVQDVNITRGSSPGVHSVAYVATMHDSLYAIDANTGAILWQDSFLNVTSPTSTTATAGVTTVPGTALNSTNLSPELGILATPAIDLSRGEIFLNAATQEARGSAMHFVQRLWGVSLADGSVISAPAIIGDTIATSTQTYTTYTGYTYVAGPIVAGSGNNASPTAYPNTDGWTAAPGGATTPVIAFNALVQMQRTAVTLMGGNVYLGFASHGDNGPYYGWLLGYSEAKLSLTAAFVTTPTYEGIVGDREDYTAQGGIWSSGSAIATDGTYLYVPTGNGAFNPSPSNFNAQGFPIDHDYGDSLLKLAVDPASSPTNPNGNGFGLKVVDYFTPSNENAMNLKDLDLSSGGVTLLPGSITDAAGNPVLIFGGKESRFYVLDTDDLGKFNDAYPLTSNPDPRGYDHVVDEYPGDGIDGTSQGIYSTPTYFDGDVVLSQAHTSALLFSAAALASGATPIPLQSSPAFGYPDPTFTVSADGASDGVLWGINVANSDLLAFDATNLTTPIYDSNTVSADAFTSAVKFGVPTVANGMAYLTTQGGAFIGYGLRSSDLASNPAFFSVPTNLAVTFDTSTDAQLTWTSNASLATEYRVDRSTNGGASWTPIALLSNGTTRYDDPTITGTAYDYRVVALSGASETTPSNTAGAPLPLSGTIMGTSGSYQNKGNVAAHAFDGNLSTYFDAPTAGTAASPNWVGLDLGGTYSITRLAYASRSGWASRMNGGLFQASNDPTFATGTVTLYTVAANANPSSTALTSQAVSASGAFRYVRYLAPAGSYGDVAEVQFFGTLVSAAPPPPTPVKLTGTAIGTAGSYKNDGNTIAKAFDGNLSTFFDAPTTNGNWAGLDLGAAAQITQISYAPRSGWAGRMVGGIFQGSDTADFSAGVVNLYTITKTPTVGVLTTVPIASTATFRYVRYLSPTGSYGDIAELQLLGIPDAMNATLTAALNVAQVQAQKTIAAIGTSANFPQYTNADGTWSWVNAGAWTAGFFPALLWQLFDATGNTADATEATQLTLAVNAASQNETSDNGFRMYLTDLPLLRQNPGDTSIVNALLTAAAAKTTTYNATVGGFEAWRGSTSGNPAANFDVLMDMIMDLPLQIWASQHGGPASELTQAIQGAVTEENYLVRPDGSSAQFAYFDSATGAFVDNETYEGYSATSTWSRGQAWGIYGFATLAALTGRADFLATAKEMANWYLAHLPSDDVPYWDFDAPSIPNAPRDTSAAAIAASGLLRLSDLLAATDPTDATTYRIAAGTTLASLASPAYLVNPADPAEGDGVLLHGALNVPATPSISDSSVIFGDSYFVEAINEYLAGS